MRAILVEDEPVMQRRFARLTKNIDDLELVGSFDDPKDALKYAADGNKVDAAFLDIELPGLINGLNLAGELKKIRDDMLIVFVSAYDHYIKAANDLGADYYLLKPYSEESLRYMMERLRLLARRQLKNIYMRTFGRFQVLKDGLPIAINGKAKEILAVLVVRRGREVSNEEIYSTVWPDRKYSNANMSVYYNALGRLKKLLGSEGLSDLLISSAHGQMINTELFDCDYYAWLDGDPETRKRFDGLFMTEYGWAEHLIWDMINDER